jgi:hypothetical protein
MNVVNAREFAAGRLNDEPLSRASELIGRLPPGYVVEAVGVRPDSQFELATFGGEGSERGSHFFFARASEGELLNSEPVAELAHGETPLASYVTIYGYASVRFGAVNYGVLRDGRPARDPHLYTLLRFRCPDQLPRVGLWTRWEAAPEGADLSKPAEALLRGSVGDRKEIARFTAEMEPCPK